MQHPTTAKRKPRPSSKPNSMMPMMVLMTTMMTENSPQQPSQPQMTRQTQKMPGMTRTTRTRRTRTYLPPLLLSLDHALTPSPSPSSSPQTASSLVCSHTSWALSPLSALWPLLLRQRVALSLPGAVFVCRSVPCSFSIRSFPFWQRLWQTEIQFLSQRIDAPVNVGLLLAPHALDCG